jgi:alpha-tubulin suppressor-like RCC1 family protein
MATVNVQNLELKLIQKISSTSSSYDLLVLSRALERIRFNAVRSVSTVSGLPSASDTTGELYWVALEEQLYFSSVAGGIFFWFPLLVDVSNQLWTWGYNGSGQLGDNTTTSRSSPGTTAGAGTTWCQVGSGRCHTMAIKTDGTLWTWGNNRCGRLGDGTITDRSSPGTTAGAGTTWCQVGSVGLHAAAVKTDGTLWTWGYNFDGQLGTGTTTSRSSPGTTAGAGTTWCQVSAGGYYHTTAVKTDGTLWTWGFNGSGQLGTGTTTDRSSPGTTAGAGTTWCQVSTGGTHTMAIKTDGTLWTWGTNYCGQLGDGTTTYRSSPGTTAGGGTTWCQVGDGRQATMAIKTDGTLWTWGNNCFGRLGDGTTTNRSSPGTTAGAGTTWCQVGDGSYYHTAAVKTDGTLWTWGSNFDGQLGDGTTTPRSSPGTTAGGGTTWCQASASGDFTAAIRSVQL